MAGNGDSNDVYVKKSSPTIHPWRLSEKYFGEGNDEKNYSGSLEGIGLGYFMEKESKI